MVPARTSIPPASPVLFAPPRATESSTSPTWEEYLASSNTFTLPVHAPFGDNPTEPRPSSYPSMSVYTSTSASNGHSPPYSAHVVFSAPPERRLLPAPIHKRKMSPGPCQTLPSPPLSAIRPALKRAARGEIPIGTQVGRWTKREHELFLEGLQRFGRSWKKISSLVHTRTLVQIRTHAQKYLQKQSRAAIKPDATATESQQHSRVAPSPLDYSSSLSQPAPQLNRLDQLLQDDSALPAFVDEYYTSPTGIEDDLLRPLLNGEQWQL
ncbi:uncharacterized protein PITG_13032 [Phytophthora infestans T30-4]|uniref:Uncharacterized protein n=1 Tax=Phytophthora infestans (strain T30-4) TaxID=403677 RepID=D0NK49_PHYIT|nr:uncharacterized protein PITG_13032 [Phytophthora infestans T30-4]EEY59886.1 conserved hypothetical protein [Phytophthora infestans T30-4]|eukprot:XP_002900571.1 conserved hypothetical protein [Phytophthora infestans T30-4]